jgi:hypothetical protein
VIERPIEKVFDRVIEESCHCRAVIVLGRVRCGKAIESFQSLRDLMLARGDNRRNDRGMARKEGAGGIETITAFLVEKCDTSPHSLECRRRDLSTAKQQ